MSPEQRQPIYQTKQKGLYANCNRQTVYLTEKGKLINLQKTKANCSSYLKKKKKEKKKRGGGGKTVCLIWKRQQFILSENGRPFI